MIGLPVTISIRDYSGLTVNWNLLESMDNGKWKMKSAFVCGLTSFSILHFPFSIHPDKSLFIGQD